MNALTPCDQGQQASRQCLTAALESGGQLLAPLQQETLVSWVVLIMTTLEEVGVPVGDQVSHSSTPRITS